MSTPYPLLNAHDLRATRSSPWPGISAFDAAAENPELAYLALVEGLRTGDVQAVCAVVEPVLAARLAAMEPTASAALLRTLRRIYRSTFRVVAVCIDGDEAVIQTAGLRIKHTLHGTVRMIRCDGRWRLHAEHWHSLELPPS